MSVGAAVTFIGYTLVDLGDGDLWDRVRGGHVKVGNLYLMTDRKRSRIEADAFELGRNLGRIEGPIKWEPPATVHHLRVAGDPT